MKSANYHSFLLHAQYCQLVSSLIIYGALSSVMYRLQNWFLSFSLTNQLYKPDLKAHQNYITIGIWNPRSLVPSINILTHSNTQHKNNHSKRSTLDLGHLLFYADRLYNKLQTVNLKPYGGKSKKRKKLFSSI